MAITKLKALGVTDGTLTNTQINASAAIAKTKLAALDIVNADINNSAAIAFSKLTGVTNGITEADEWRFNTNPNNVSGILNSWERNDTNFEKIGTGMTQSSGIFSFPSTGKWLINFHVYVYGNTFTRYNDMYSQIAQDGSNYYTNSYHSFPIPWASSYMHTGGSTSCQFDVTSISTHKIKFMFNPENPANCWIQGSSSANNTYVQFFKLSET